MVIDYIKMTYYQLNREKVLAYGKKYREEHKEQISQYKKDNRDLMNKHAAKYREANRELLREKSKQYNKDNREKNNVKVTCECGAVVCRKSMTLHKTSLSHINWFIHF